VCEGGVFPAPSRDPLEVVRVQSGEVTREGSRTLPGGRDIKVGPLLKGVQAVDQNYDDRISTLEATPCSEVTCTVAPF
jgi:hypothetical protein